MILNLSVLGILVSMLKKEKHKVQEANAQIAKLCSSQSSLQSSSSSTDTERRIKQEASDDSTHAEHVKYKQNGEQSNTLLQIVSALHHHIYIHLTPNPLNVIVFNMKAWWHIWDEFKETGSMLELTNLLWIV